MIGRMLGHYRIVEKIGEGGMGEVYRAYDEHLSRDVAIKVLPPGMLHEQSSRRHFRAEALNLSRISHPNIETVFDFNTQEGVDFLVMEYVSGQNLADRLAGGPFSEHDTIKLGIQLAQGLAAAHDQGIVHRDLKPANLSITPDGRLKILDFGLSRSLPKEMEQASTQSSAARAGTLHYMAPEQLLGHWVDTRCDIYAAGLVLFEMVTGRRAFDVFKWEVKDGSLYRKPSPIPLERELSPALAKIVSKCIEVERDMRYESARDLQFDLQRMESPEGTLPDSLGPSRKLHGYLSLAIAALIVITAGAGIWYYTAWKGGTEPLPPFQLTQITADPAWEGHPAIAPDGTQIAYVFRDAERREIRVIDIASQQWRRVTGGSATEDHPAWSRDSKELFYDCDRSAETSIFRVSTQGGEPSLVVRDAAEPAVSRDGEWIAFTRVVANGFRRIGVAPLADMSRQVVLTGEEDGMGDHESPCWSVDTKSLCYSSLHNLWIVSSRGGRAHPLTADNSWDVEPVFSPSGLHVFFSAYRRHGGILSLWRVNKDGGSLAPVTLGTDQESHASISREGTRLAFARGAAERELVILDRSSGREFTIPYRRDDSIAAMAPDKSGIAYVSMRGEPNANIWFQALSGDKPSEQLRRLTNETGILSHPTFSPDGKWIACYRLSGQTRNIYLVPAQGGQAIQFTTGRWNTQPAWSPDASKLAFVSDRGGSHQIWIAGVKDGKPNGPASQLTTGAWYASAPSWSQDGSRIAFVVGAQGENAEVWLVRSDGTSRPHQLTTGAGALRVRWDPLSNDLLVSGSWGHDDLELRRVSVDDGRARFLDKTPVVFGYKSESLPTFDLSADGKLLLFCRENLNSDIYLIQLTKGVF